MRLFSCHVLYFYSLVILFACLSLGFCCPSRVGHFGETVIIKLQEPVLSPWHILTYCRVNRSCLFKKWKHNRPSRLTQCCTQFDSIQFVICNTICQTDVTQRGLQWALVNLRSLLFFNLCHLALPFPVDEENGYAKFDKSKRRLIVTLPVLRPPMPNFLEQTVGVRFICLFCSLPLRFCYTVKCVILINANSEKNFQDAIMTKQVRCLLLGFDFLNIENCDGFEESSHENRKPGPHLRFTRRCELSTRCANPAVPKPYNCRICEPNTLEFVHGNKIIGSLRNDKGNGGDNA